MGRKTHAMAAHGTASIIDAWGCGTQSRPGGRTRDWRCTGDGGGKPRRINGLAGAARERQRPGRLKRENAGGGGTVPGGQHGRHAWRRGRMADQENSLENRRVFTVFARMSYELRRVAAKQGGFRRDRDGDGRGRRRMNGRQRCREVPGDVTAGSAGAPARAVTQVSEVLRRVVRDGRDGWRCTSAQQSASACDREGDHERRRFRRQSPERVRGRQCAARCRGRRAKRGGERGAKRARE